MNSISTSMEKARLKALDWAQPISSVVVYILYAKGTCWKLFAGRRPTCGFGSVKHGRVLGAYLVNHAGETTGCVPES